MALALQAVMLTAALTACGDGGNDSQGSTGQEVQTDLQDQSADREKIVIALQQSTNVEDYDSNYFTRLLEEEMNIDIEFMVLPASGEDARSKLSMLVSS